MLNNNQIGADSALKGVLWDVLAPQIKSLVAESIKTEIDRLLPNTKTSQVERTMTIDEVVEALKISRPSVHRLLNAGVLTRIKVGNCTRISMREFDEALKSGKLKKYRRI